jgi:predicted RNase H-like HicB family nuclease
LVGLCVVAHDQKSMRKLGFGKGDTQAGGPIVKRAMGTQIELVVQVRQEADMYWAEVPSHPGLFASGETMDELIEALGEAWALYTSDDRSVPQAAVTPATRSLRVLVPA